MEAKPVFKGFESVRRASRKLAKTRGQLLEQVVLKKQLEVSCWSANLVIFCCFSLLVVVMGVVARAFAHAGKALIWRLVRAYKRDTNR